MASHPDHPTPRPVVLPISRWNVLSIVAEVDCAPLLAAGGGPLFAVAGETVITGKIPVRLERVGRPEIKNVILSPKDHDPVNSDLESRDLYNLCWACR